MVITFTGSSHSAFKCKIFSGFTYSNSSIIFQAKVEFHQFLRQLCTLANLIIEISSEKGNEKRVLMIAMEKLLVLSLKIWLKSALSKLLVTYYLLLITHIFISPLSQSPEPSAHIRRRD